jgi:hypothetical protein
MLHWSAPGGVRPSRLPRYRTVKRHTAIHVRTWQRSRAVSRNEICYIRFGFCREGTGSILQIFLWKSTDFFMELYPTSPEDETRIPLPGCGGPESADGRGCRVVRDMTWGLRLQSTIVHVVSVPMCGRFSRTASDYAIQAVRMPAPWVLGAPEIAGM